MKLFFAHADLALLECREDLTALERGLIEELRKTQADRDMARIALAWERTKEHNLIRDDA